MDTTTTMNMMATSMRTTIMATMRKNIPTAIMTTMTMATRTKRNIAITTMMTIERALSTYFFQPFTIMLKWL
jgi:hypothetical protein